MLTPGKLVAWLHIGSVIIADKVKFPLRFELTLEEASGPISFIDGSEYEDKQLSKSGIRMNFVPTLQQSLLPRQSAH